jgi:hypothetical protein
MTALECPANESPELHMVDSGQMRQSGEDGGGNSMTWMCNSRTSREVDVLEASDTSYNASKCRGRLPQRREADEV